MAEKKFFVDINLQGSDITNLKADTLDITSNLASANTKRIVYWSGQYYYSNGTSWIALGAAGTLPVGGVTGDILAKASGTDYDVEWISNYTSTVQHEVKLAENISKGQAAYVSSANGTNMLVSKASNATEATSSKTMGLIASTGVTNDIVFLITEGLLAGLDTSTATAGDPVWLGTNGNLIYGLVNKPVAPAHLVFIGIVTRAQSNNGEIFVKVQNGFELGELHNVDALNASNNDGLFYNTTTSLWEHKSIATALGYTPENVANKSTDVSLGTSDTLYPTQNAVKVYTDNILGNSNALVYKGTIDCSTNPDYPTADAGWMYIASVAGKIGGVSGTDVEVGDMIICNTDGTVSGNQATVGQYWNVIQKNIIGAVTGPASSVNNTVAVFDGTTGKVIKQGIITDTGTNIGIGTTTPTQKLSVTGGAVTADNYYINGIDYAQVPYRYVKQVSGIAAGSWTNICNVLGDSLSSGVRISIMGTGSATVVDVVADILVNHFQDIYVESRSGKYTTLTLRIISDDNQNFTIQATTNSLNSLTTSVEVFPLNSESVIFDSITPYSGMLLEHDCVPGLSISSTDGTSSDINNITTRGKVGVGLINPASQLHVRGIAIPSDREILAQFDVSDDSSYFRISNVTGTDGNFIPSLEGYNSTEKIAMYFLANGATDSGTEPLINYNARIGQAPVVTRPLFNWSNYNSNKMTMLANGNLGIGTETPTTKLDVDGNYKFGPAGGILFGSYGAGTNLDMTVLNTGGWIGASKISTSDSNGTVFFGAYGLDTSLISSHWTIGSSSSSAGQELTTGIHLLKNGNVGIGITNPTAKLHVNNTAAGNSFLVEDDSNVDNTPFIIDTQGRVGIGTINPDAKLQVDGDVYINGSHYVYHPVNSTSGYLNLDHAGVQMWKIGIFNDNTSTFSIGNGAGNTFGDRVLNLTTGGNLGLGTNTPTTKLEVNGDVKVSTIANATTDTDKFLVSDSGVIKYRTGAEVLSDLGAQGSLTVTTTGTNGAATFVGNTLNIPVYESSLIPKMSGNEIWRGSTFRNNSTTTDTTGGLTFVTPTGTATARSVATTSYATKSIRMGVVSNSTVVGRYTGIRGSVLLWYVTGGFLYTGEFNISDTAFVTGTHNFWGLASSTSDLLIGGTNNDQPSALTNIIAFANDSGDANLQIMHNDASGTATKTDLGSSFPSNRTAGIAITTIYSCYLYNAPNSSDVIYRIVNKETGAVAQGTLSTNLPAATVGLNFFGARTMGTQLGGINNSGQFDVYRLGVYSL